MSKECGDGFTLFPLSDVHWPYHDAEKLEEWRRQVLATPNSIVTLGGDLFDFARGKYRSHLNSYTADDNSRSPIDELAWKWVDEMAEFLGPVRDRILMTCVGNHFWRFQNGRVSDQELVNQLGRPNSFVGAFGIARLKVGPASIKVALHHDAGKKGGTASSDLLAFKHWSSNVAADIFLAGHTHRQYAGIFETRITVGDDEDKIRDQKLVFIRTGAFLKGYGGHHTSATEPFVPDYAEVAMLPPSVLGIVSVRVGLLPSGRPQYEIRQLSL
jgi:predicted phosphodiesterase